MLALVTLQRLPPLTRIFAPGFAAPSSRVTFRSGLSLRAKIAVARPAAPAPTTTTSFMRVRNAALRKDADCRLHQAMKRSRLEQPPRQDRRNGRNGGRFDHTERPGCSGLRLQQSPHAPFEILPLEERQGGHP